MTGDPAAQGLGHDVVNNIHAQAGATGRAPGGKERIKNFGYGFRSHPPAVILITDHQVFLFDRYAYFYFSGINSCKGGVSGN